MDNLTKQGVDAFRAGDKDEARKLLLKAVKQNPNNERAWGWLYNVTNSDKESIYCLKQMLRINPENKKVKDLLGQTTNYEPPLQSSPRTITNNAQYQTQEKKKFPTWAKILLSVIAGIVGIVVLCNLATAGLLLAGPQINENFEKIDAELSGTATTPPTIVPLPASAVEQVTKTPEIIETVSTPTAVFQSTFTPGNQDEFRAYLNSNYSTINGQKLKFDNIIISMEYTILSIELTSESFDVFRDQSKADATEYATNLLNDTIIFFENQECSAHVDYVYTSTEFVCAFDDEWCSESLSTDATYLIVIRKLVSVYYIMSDKDIEVWNYK